MPHFGQPAPPSDFPELGANLMRFAGALAGTTISVLTRRFAGRNGVGGLWQAMPAPRQAAPSAAHAHLNITVTCDGNIVRHHYRCCCVPPCHGCRR